MVQPLPSWKINNKTVKNIGFHFFPHVVTLYVSFFEIGPFNQVTCYSKFLFGRVRCCCPYSLIFRLYLQTPAHPKQIYPRFPFHQKTLPKKAVVYSSQVRFNPPSPSPTSRFFFSGGAVDRNIGGWIFSAKGTVWAHETGTSIHFKSFLLLVGSWELVPGESFPGIGKRKRAV